MPGYVREKIHIRACVISGTTAQWASLYTHLIDLRPSPIVHAAYLLLLSIHLPTDDF